jgi:RNA polymerase sigma-70 factor (ECF subfamily)
VVDLPRLSDPALVREIQHGNETALEEFYRRFAPGLHGFIRRQVNPQDVEDILAETMAAAVTAIMRFQGQSQVFSWLCRIAGFKVADYYRKRHGDPNVDLESVQSQVTAASTDYEENFVVHQVLHRLGSDYRRVLSEKYIAGYSTREIAARIGRSEKAVESILVRARKAFEREYRKLMPEGGASR